MAYKTLLFGTDDLFETLKPFYLKAAEQGVLEIVAAAVFENGGIRFVTGNSEINSIDIDLAIISSQNNFYERMKQLEAMGIPRNRIIDGRVFQVPNLDFPRLLKEGVAHGICDNNCVRENVCPIYTRIYGVKSRLFKLILGKKSYIRHGNLEGYGIVSVKNFSSLAWNIIFELSLNYVHNMSNVMSYALMNFDWSFPKEFIPPQGTCKILIGNDVWIGRGCILKSTNPNKPLVIGDGAVIASDSVVVKNVPPYAIVGGNPAKIIKYRFEPHVIESLLRIKWWDWSLDKIHDNFKYFNDVEKFISLHDKEG